MRVHHHTPTPVEISRQFVTYYLPLGMTVGVVSEIVLPFTFISPYECTDFSAHPRHSPLECVQMALLDGEAKLGAPRMMAETQQWLA